MGEITWRAGVVRELLLASPSKVFLLFAAQLWAGNLRPFGRTGLDRLSFTFSGRAHFYAYIHFAPTWQWGELLIFIKKFLPAFPEGVGVYGCCAAGLAPMSGH
jgi:hypothetical protein